MKVKIKFECLMIFCSVNFAISLDFNETENNFDFEEITTEIDSENFEPKSLIELA
jgi:hypothetical protein